MNYIKIARQHLKETGWSYRYHLWHSLIQSGRLIVIAIKSAVHGFMPWLYPASGPVGIYRIYKEIRHLHHVQKIFNQDDNQGRENQPADNRPMRNP